MMDTKPSQSGSKAFSDFDSVDEDSVLGDNGDEGSKLGDEPKEIDFPEEAKGGDLEETTTAMPCLSRLKASRTCLN